MVNYYWRLINYYWKLLLTIFITNIKQKQEILAEYLELLSMNSFKKKNTKLWKVCFAVENIFITTEWISLQTTQQLDSSKLYKFVLLLI